MTHGISKYAPNELKAYPQIFVRKCIRIIHLHGKTDVHKCNRIIHFHGKTETNVQQ